MVGTFGFLLKLLRILEVKVLYGPLGREPLVRGKVAPVRVVAERGPRQNPEPTYRNRIRGRSGRMTWLRTGKSDIPTKF
jgi:hypothetical protein